MPIIAPNQLRTRLADGGLAIGTMVTEIRQIAIMQGLANAAFDWVILDNEHGVFNPETLADLSRAARWLGITPIVRIPVPTYDRITQALDGGAQGIMLPRVKSAADVRVALEAMKYGPTGGRGSTLSRGHTDFKGGDVIAMMAESNRETFLIVQIETREAVEQIDEILSVPGVDAGFIGPNDLAIALGVTGRMRDPVLERAIEATLAACARHRVHPGIHTNDVQLTADWAKRGMRLVSISSEMGLFGKAASEAVATIRNA